jgi:plastocyanin
MTEPMKPILASALALLLAACGASGPTPSLSPADCAQPDADGVVTLSADTLDFSAPCIAVPADAAFTIKFTNTVSNPHNVSIYDSAAKGTQYLNGEHISKDQTVDYPVPALAAGTYFFVCDLHPVMNGPLFATAAVASGD